MSIVCGLDLHRQQITFDALTTESGAVWRGRTSQPDRERFRRWLCRDVARRACGEPLAMAVEGCTGWRCVVEEIVAAGFEAHLAEPADTQAARGRKRHATTDRSDARLLRECCSPAISRVVRVDDVRAHGATGSRGRGEGRSSTGPSFGPGPHRDGRSTPGRPPRRTLPRPPPARG